MSEFKIPKYSDRELLELAAKAAELQGLDWRNGSQAFYYDDSETGREEWNPICKDGQSLRLAVKLGISIEITNMSSTVAWYPFDIQNSLTEWHGNDPYLATRLAIVRAAAEIGKSRILERESGE